MPTCAGPSAALILAAALAAALMVGAAVPAGAQEGPPGASSCSGCHPAAGGGAVPALRGQPPEQIAAAMRAYRSGERPATVMDRIAKGFSDEEIQAIAGWVSGNR